VLKDHESSKNWEGNIEDSHRLDSSFPFVRCIATQAFYLDVSMNFSILRVVLTIILFPINTVLIRIIYNHKAEAILDGILRKLPEVRI